jgi:hypothetical protein
MHQRAGEAGALDDEGVARLVLTLGGASQA